MIIRPTLICTKIVWLLLIHSSVEEFIRAVEKFAKDAEEVGKHYSTSRTRILLDVPILQALISVVLGVTLGRDSGLGTHYSLS
jgi:hypothetical protein